MAAGFRQYPVGKLVDAGKPTSRVTFSTPPERSALRPEKAAYHILLMGLCQVSSRRFTTLLSNHATGRAIPLTSAVAAPEAVVQETAGNDASASSVAAPQSDLCSTDAAV